MLARESVKALSSFVRAAARADRVEIAVERALPSDAGRMHYLIAADIAGGPMAGRRTLVMRGQADDREMTLASAEEFAIRQVAFSAGLTTPEPLWLEPNGDVLGKPFMVLRFAGGTADAAVLQEELSVEEGDRLAYRLGQELARLHAIRMDQALAGIAFLPRPDADWMQQGAAAWRAALDGVSVPQPCFEWAINWLADHAPKVERFALCHRDLRLGNFAAEGERLTGIFDLELAGWSDPMEDLGWLCVRAWRFGSPLPVGGIGERDEFFRAYERAGGDAVDPEVVRFWEALGDLKWAVICIAQAKTFLDGGVKSVELASIGRRTAEAEHDFLELVD